MILLSKSDAHLVKDFNSIFTKNPISVFEKPAWDFKRDWPSVDTQIHDCDYETLMEYKAAVEVGKPVGDFYQFCDELVWNKSDREYWKEVYGHAMTFRWLIPSKSYRSYAFKTKYEYIKYIKKERYYKRIGYLRAYYESDPCVRYGVKVGNWLWKQIEEYSHQCRDNCRFARADSNKEKRHYGRLKRGGCCGFFDERVKCPIDGNTYLVGCNYGH